MTEGTQAQQIEVPAETAAPVVEKQVPQSVVDKTVTTAKMIAKEQGRREALAEMQAQQQAAQMQQMQQAIPQNSQLSPEIQQQIAFETQRQQQVLIEQQRQQHNHMMAQQTANEFHSKMQAGLDKYPDLLDKIDALGLPQIPQIVDLINRVDNAADVVADLHENPHKIGGMLNSPPHLALLQIQKLSRSIASNNKGMQQQFANEPLGQAQPSLIKGDNDGGRKLTPADYKRKYRK